MEEEIDMYGKSGGRLQGAQGRSWPRFGQCVSIALRDALRETCNQRRSFAVTLPHCCGTQLQAVQKAQR